MTETSRELWTARRGWGAALNLILDGEFTGHTRRWASKGNVGGGASTPSFRNLFPHPVPDLIAHDPEIGLLVRPLPEALGVAPDRAVSRLAAVCAVGALLLCGACAEGGPSTSGINSFPQPRPTLTSQYRPSAHAAAGDAFVHLFQWTWANVATECETVLGPAGWKGVQVSPPQEHARAIRPGMWSMPR